MERRRFLLLAGFGLATLKKPIGQQPPTSIQPISRRLRIPSRMAAAG